MSKTTESLSSATRSRILEAVADAMDRAAPAEDWTEIVDAALEDLDGVTTIFEHVNDWTVAVIEVAGTRWIVTLNDESATGARRYAIHPYPADAESASAGA